MKRTLFPLSIALLVPLIVLIGCDDDEDIVDPSDDMSTAMFINASPGPEQVEVLVGGVEQADQLGFPDNTDYQPIEDGTQLVTVQFDNQPIPVLDTVTATFSALEVYSIFVGDTGTATTLMVVQDELNSPDTNTVAVRFVHLSPNVGNVRLAVVGTDSVFANADNVGYMEATRFEPEIADQYQVWVEQAVTGDTIALSTLDTYEAGKIYTLFLTGYDGGIAEEELTLNRILNQ